MSCRSAARSNPNRTLPRLIGPTLVCWLTAGVAGGAVPTLDHFHPAGVARDTTNMVKIAGKVEPWPPKVWVNGPGIEFLAETNQGEFQVIVTADATPGTRLVRLLNEEGTSEPRPFVIGKGTEIIESEPNDHFDMVPEIAALPLTVNGRLDKNGDVDSFTVSLKAGQTLEARIESHVLMSRLDAVLRLVTTNGLQLDWNHDHATLDPLVRWIAPSDQNVVVQVFGFPYPATANVRLTGGDGAVYRLHLSAREGPVDEPTGVEMRAECPEPSTLPFVGHGVIRAPDATQRIKLNLAKDQWIVARVAASSMGSPMDPWVRIEDKEGKELARNDDANESPDPELEWKAPADGEFIITVGALTRRAGPDQRYELMVERVEPDYLATAGASSLTVKPGSTNELTVTVTRLRGYTNELQVLAEGLPSGVHCDPVSVQEKGGEVKLNFNAQADAAAYQGPFQLLVRESSGASEKPVPFLLTGNSVDNGVPGGYRVLLADRINELWLTVAKVDAEPAAAGTAGTSP